MVLKFKRFFAVVLLQFRVWANGLKTQAQGRVLSFSIPRKHGTMQGMGVKWKAVIW